MLNRNHKLAVFDWGLTLLVGALLASPVFAAEKEEAHRTGEKAILAALDEPTDVQFIDEPLSGVVDHFKQAHNIEIQIDEPALQDVSMGSDTPVTKSLHNLKFRSALNLILRDLDLTWTIADEVLIITTPEEAESHLITRVYDVGKLVTVQDPGGKRWSDFDALIRVITSTIDSERWNEVGGPGSIAEMEYRGAAVLVISHTYDVHLKVAELLDDLAKIADKYGDDVIPTRTPKPSQPPASGMPGFGGGGMGGFGGGGMGGGAGYF